jgi:hypothetical protein
VIYFPKGTGFHSELAGSDGDGDVLVDVLLKSLVNHAVKKYADDKGTADDEEEEDDDDLSSPLPQRRIPSDADADDDDADADDDEEDAVQEQDSEAVDEAAELPKVEIEIDNEYDEDYQLSQKMDMMSLRCRY